MAQWPIPTSKATRELEQLEERLRSGEITAEAAISRSFVIGILFERGKVDARREAEASEREEA